MSIIYDALKKVENKMDTGVTENKPKPKINIKIAGIFILVCISGFLISGFLFKNYEKNLKAKSPDLKNIALKTESPKPAVALESDIPDVEEKPSLEEKDEVVLTAKTPPELSLSGIFFSNDKIYALINNRIVKEGDTIEAAKVMKISKDSVELDFEGLKIRLSGNFR